MLTEVVSSCLITQPKDQEKREKSNNTLNILSPYTIIILVLATTTSPSLQPAQQPKCHIKRESKRSKSFSSNAAYCQEHCLPPNSNSCSAEQMFALPAPTAMVMNEYAAVPDDTQSQGQKNCGNSNGDDLFSVGRDHQKLAMGTTAHRVSGTTITSIICNSFI